MRSPICAASVVIAADRPPAALEALGADVRSRLSGGLVIALDKPDRATRLAILKSRADENARTRPQRRAAAETCWSTSPTWKTHSPRDLIGVFTKLATYADLTKKPVTLEVAEETLGQRNVLAPQDLHRGHPEEDGRVLQARIARLPFARSARAAWRGRARWRCIWPAN